MSGPEIRFENWASAFLHPKSGVGADIKSLRPVVAERVKIREMSITERWVGEYSDSGKGSLIGA